MVIQNLDPPPYDSVFTGLGEGTYVITGLVADSVVLEIQLQFLLLNFHFRFYLPIV